MRRAALAFKLVHVAYRGGAAGPAGLPRDIVQKLNVAVNKAMTVPEAQEHLQTEIVQTKAMTPDEMTAFMQREIARRASTARRIAAQR